MSALLERAPGRVGSERPAGRAAPAKDLLAHARKVQSALAFPTDPRDGPAELDSFAALCDHVRGLAALHGPLTLSTGFAHYPGFDGFHAVTVKDATGLSVAYLADRWNDAEDVRLALGVLRHAATEPRRAAA